jgi:hypothetical protein
MKITTQIFSYFFFPMLLLAQLPSSKCPFSMSWEQNQQWLMALKAQEKHLQWKMITQRYFQSNVTAVDETKQKVTPVLIVNGLPIFITDSTSLEVKHKLLSLLTEDKIADIRVLEKLPEALYIEKQFTGLIVATLNDKRASKALKKIRVN